MENARARANDCLARLLLLAAESAIFAPVSRSFEPVPRHFSLSLAIYSPLLSIPCSRRLRKTATMISTISWVRAATPAIVPWINTQIVASAGGGREGGPRGAAHARRRASLQPRWEKS